MGVTDDPNDPRLGHGSNDAPVPQNEVYLVLSKEERAKGFVRPYHESYRHARDSEDGKILACGGVTTMNSVICETYARDPKFYGSTYCVRCAMHLPVNLFDWTDNGGGVVGE